MEKDRLSILKRVEQGEISIEEAKEILGLTNNKSHIPEAEEKEEKLDKSEASKKSHIPSRRNRKLALAEKFYGWEPNTMITLGKNTTPFQWPWPDKYWKWMWQNPEYPIYINHSMELPEETHIKIITHYGDIFFRGWDQPKLQIYGAIFDLRIGQETNIINMASSTGQIQIMVPQSVTNIDAQVSSGDMWISNVSANMKLNCQSGDLGCEYIKGDVKALVNGGDTRLVGIDGAIYVDSINGNTHVKNIQSSNVSIRAEEGDISLSLNSVTNGQFRCENDKGDINMIISDELSSELLVEATKGGRIAPVILPWKRLIERSQHKLHGIIKEGGASISLITQSGTIYIQESFMNIKSSRISS